MLKDSGVPVVCCGEPMKQLIPGETDASLEKHVPDAVQKEQVVQVQVGRIAHPMTPEHRIEWIVLETQQGFSVRRLRPGDAPEALFALPDTETAVGAYAYCNLHGLWQSML